MVMDELTPYSIRERAYGARISINKLFKSARVSNSTLWRWEKDITAKPNPVTLGKIEDALASAERAHTERMT